MLNDKEIKRLIKEQNLIENCDDIDEHITPNGFDLSIESIECFAGAGKLLHRDKSLPQSFEHECNDGVYLLQPGIYLVNTIEKINMPNNLVGFAFPRSSLLRMGCLTQTGVWDAGFSGTSQFIVNVVNPFGVYIEKGARITQLCFEWINTVEKSYNGAYQNFDLKKEVK